MIYMALAGYDDGSGAVWSRMAQQQAGASANMLRSHPLSGERPAPGNYALQAAGIISGTHQPAGRTNPAVQHHLL
ncbi:MAG: hypothetical protein R3E95_04840 [Thiolinea sp.]